MNKDNFDYTYQKELADKYEIIEEQKQVLLAKARKLEEISVVLPQKHDIKWAYPLITDLFYPQGGCSEYTKKWVSENVGEIPLYSGATSGVYANVNRADYDGEFLSPSDIKAMKDTTPVPIREDGTYDIDRQKELADKYEQIEEIKRSLINRITELTEIVVV